MIPLNNPVFHIEYVPKHSGEASLQTGECLQDGGTVKHGRALEATKPQWAESALRHHKCPHVTLAYRGLRNLGEYWPQCTRAWTS
ncbi:hypothetical protein IAQ61_006843 [Plenodomus lingam]|uniref:uncharacterized protein n=1 Tax=Leptosphaeria maculans TaxID=5022 RepID=UPI0033192369|nr:hypothetical protein IAQ61_006843 [Plenodomus lingam]